MAQRLGRLLSEGDANGLNGLTPIGVFQLCARTGRMFDRKAGRGAKPGTWGKDSETLVHSAGSYPYIWAAHVSRSDLGGNAYPG